LHDLFALWHDVSGIKHKSGSWLPARSHEIAVEEHAEAGVRQAIAQVSVLLP
jgi:hypothetical protein